MKKRDYYSVLGVRRTASVGSIRAAYRRLAKSHHPDLAGSENTRLFQEIVEAYCVLSDPACRRDYDARLRREETEEDLSVRIRSDLEGQCVFSRPTSVAARERFPETSILFEQLLRGFFREFGPIGGSAGNSPRVTNVEIILSQQEAAAGGALSIPVSVPCPGCMGAGHTGLTPCSRCLGEGRVDGPSAVRVEIPAGTQDGTLIEMPVNNAHLGQILFRLFIRVG